jgi:ATP-dependent RNA helicase DDX56/DBP9
MKAPGSSGDAQKTRALVLVPTRELAEQVTTHMSKLLVYCEKEIIVVNVASGGTTHLQRWE